MKLFQILAILAALSSATAFAEPRACRISQTSDGDYGVKEYRYSGWVYILRQLSYEDAVKALEHLQASGRCQ